MGGSNATVITAACSAAAAVVVVVVVVVLVVVLIKIRRRKHSSEVQEAINFEENDLVSTNTFSGGLSVSHIEEDPFADDFKENKFVGQI